MKILTLKAEAASKRFEFLAFNRPVKPSAVKALVDSIMRNGVIRPVTIIRTKAIDGRNGSYIGDGQHLFRALERLERDIPYVEINCATLKDVYHVIIQLNTTARSWRLEDYLRVSASSGLKPYQKMISLFETTGLSYTHLTTILCGTSRTTTKVRDGTFRIERRNFALAVVNDVVEIKGLVPLNNDQILAYYQFREDLLDDKEKYDIDNMIAIITHNEKTFHNVWNKSAVDPWRLKFHELWESGK